VFIICRPLMPLCSVWREYTLPLPRLETAARVPRVRRNHFEFCGSRNRLLLQDHIPFQLEDMMRADLVEVSWDAEKKKWLVRIQAGDEVIRRHSDAPKDADEQALRSAAQKVMRDEGYEPTPAQMTIRR
jgi:hypothetical protein